MKHENLKCMGIMQDDLCHPYILSTTVLSDIVYVCTISLLSFMGGGNGLQSRPRM